MLAVGERRAHAVPRVVRNGAAAGFLLVQGAGCWVLGVGFWVLGFGFALGCRS